MCWGGKGGGISCVHGTRSSSVVVELAGGGVEGTNSGGGGFLVPKF